jgi:hypothetical protein
MNIYWKKQLLKGRRTNEKIISDTVNDYLGERVDFRRLR